MASWRRPNAATSRSGVNLAKTAAKTLRWFGFALQTSCTTTKEIRDLMAALDGSEQQQDHCLLQLSQPHELALRPHAWPTCRLLIIRVAASSQELSLVWRLAAAASAACDSVTLCSRPRRKVGAEGPRSTASSTATTAEPTSRPARA